MTLTESDTSVCKADSTAVSAYSGAGIVADCNTLLGLMDELRGTGSLDWSADTAMADWDGITVSGNRVTRLYLSKGFERFDPARVGPVDEPDGPLLARQ